MATKKTTSKAVEEDLEVDSKIDILDEVAEEKVVDPNMIKKKDIYDHVSVTTGLRKRDVREAVDCLLEYLNKTLAEGKTVQAPPLGKIKSVERGSGDNIKTHYKLSLKNMEQDEKKAS